jgi:hypothetical protein
MTVRDLLVALSGLWVAGYTIGLCEFDRGYGLWYTPPLSLPEERRVGHTTVGT